MKTLLTRTIEIVTFLFGAFGHFLTRIAPPDSTGIDFTIGFSSMACLCILLLVSLIAKRLPAKKHKRFWLWPAVLCLAIALGSGLLYSNNFRKLTFPYPQDTPTGRHISGTDLTAKALDYLKKDSTKTIPEMVADFGGPEAKKKIWTQLSIDRSENKLTYNYLILVIAFSSGIFCLLEGLAKDI